MRDELQHDTNVDESTVAGFGAEWQAFNFAGHDQAELDAIFGAYFSVFPWASLLPDATGFDAGCGSGRWAARVAPRVGTLHCVDASEEALAVARGNLAGLPNCQFHRCSVAEMPIADGSMDFGYSLGVLHHLPNTQGALTACVQKLKPGAPFLVYLYYALENRSLPYRALWRTSDVMRAAVSRLPFRLRYSVSQVLAGTVYWPLARFALLAESIGLPAESLPLSGYRNRSFYVMRNDALDRFGTRLEQRFRRDQVEALMRCAGLERIEFREEAPFWCAVGYRRAGGPDANVSAAPTR